MILFEINSCRKISEFFLLFKLIDPSLQRKTQLSVDMLPALASFIEWHINMKFSDP